MRRRFSTRNTVTGTLSPGWYDAIFVVDRFDCVCVSVDDCYRLWFLHHAEGALTLPPVPLARLHEL
jgi:hypothetical protein